MKLLPITAVAIALGLFVPVRAQQVTPVQQSDPSATAPPAGGMMNHDTMNHDTMMTDIKATDVRLEMLVRTMRTARGDDKVLAMQELLAELVQDQVAMHGHMSMMHTMMMSHMPAKGASK